MVRMAGDISVCLERRLMGRTCHSPPKVQLHIDGRTVSPWARSSMMAAQEQVKFHQEIPSATRILSHAVGLSPPLTAATIFLAWSEEPVIDVSMMISYVVSR